MPPGSAATLQIRDYASEAENAELSPIEVPSYQIDAANLATWLTGWGAFKTATDAVILGVQAHEIVNIYNTALSGAVPVSEFAQRELKMRVTYQGDTSLRKRRVEIPTPDLAALTLTGKDSIVLADGGVMAAWVTAFEAIARMSDDDAEEVTVIGAKVVGRNI
jgi:hypothetical protein